MTINQKHKQIATIFGAIFVALIFLAPVQAAYAKKSPINPYKNMHTLGDVKDYFKFDTQRYTAKDIMGACKSIMNGVKGNLNWCYSSMAYSIKNTNPQMANQLCNKLSQLSGKEAGKKCSTGNGRYIT